MQVRKGFTLVELSLSLAFIGVLSLTIAFIINDAVASYRRGVTLKQINTTGIGLVDDMRAAVQSSSTKPARSECFAVYGKGAGGAAKVKMCEEDNARNFVSLTRLANVEGVTTLRNVPVFGAFCTGTYTYIWNSGYYFNKEANAYKVKGVSSAVLKYKDATGAKKEISNFRLLKIKDNSRAACIAASGSGYLVSEIDSVFDMTKDVDPNIEEEPIDLLGSDEVNGGLAIYDLSVSGPAESTTKNSLFYSVSFILGTVQGGINVKKSGGYCATPEEHATENFDYCAINKFNFAAKATGGR